MEVLIERPDGSRVTVVVNIRSLKNERGEITGAINCFYDITERKQAEERQRLLMDELVHRGAAVEAAAPRITVRRDIRDVVALRPTIPATSPRRHTFSVPRITRRGAREKSIWNIFGPGDKSRSRAARGRCEACAPRRVPSWNGSDARCHCLQPLELPPGLTYCGPQGNDSGRLQRRSAQGVGEASTRQRSGAARNIREGAYSPSQGTSRR